MFHKFKRWRNKEKYSEAYLVYKDGRIHESKKSKRIEIGPNEYEEESTFVTIAEPVDLNKKKQYEKKDESIHPGEVDEDNRTPEEPKSKITYFWLMFWILFLITALYYFIPFTEDLLNKDISGSLPTYTESPSDIVNDEEDNTNITEETTANELGEVANEITDLETKSPIELDLGAVVEGVRENSPIDITLAGDKMTTYADVHALIVQQSTELRDIAQRYVSRNAQHVQMSSLGGRIDIRLNQADYRLSQMENDELNILLTQRIERLRAMSRRTIKLDRTNASSEVNNFLDEENHDGALFISKFVQSLEQEGRSYSLEDGFVVFN